MEKGIVKIKINCSKRTGIHLNRVLSKAYGSKLGLMSLVNCYYEIRRASIKFIIAPESYPKGKGVLLMQKGEIVETIEMSKGIVTYIPRIGT